MTTITRKLETFYLFQKRMYRSEVHHFFILLKYNDNKQDLVSLLHFSLTLS